MKKQFLIVVVVLMIGLASFAQDSGEFTVPLTDPTKRGRLKVDIHFGSIKVKGSPRKDVLVRYSSDEESGKRKQPDEREGLKRISGGTLELEVSEKSNLVIVESSSWSKKTNVEIEVPSGFDLKASSYNDGDISIMSIQGEVEITTYNGEIDAENISGSVVATTYNGDVKVTFDKVTSVPMSYSTYNGDIDLTFPATIKASLKMKTQQGEILSAFDMSVVKNEPIQKKDSGTGSFKIVLDEWVKADIGGGGPEISMRNYNGDIKIRKRGS
jgi:DUF4097 and DUF4098 domain-containing protein YvlB